MGHLRTLVPGVESTGDGPELPEEGDEAGNGQRRDESDHPTTDRATDPSAEQLVTPKERVLTLLARNGGRMKQGDLVSAVEWSESTVSRKLGGLEAEEAIVRYRIGREKVVFLPGEEPESFRSPLDRDEPKKLAA